MDLGSTDCGAVLINAAATTLLYLQALFALALAKHNAEDRSCSDAKEAPRRLAY
jgi:hypothetical protein